MGGRVWPLTVSGPLAPYGAGYVSWLEARGFSPGALGGRVWQLDHLSRWLEREGLVGAGLTLGRVEEFLVARQAAGYVTWVSALSMRTAACVLARGRRRADGAVGGGGGAA